MTPKHDVLTRDNSLSGTETQKRRKTGEVVGSKLGAPATAMARGAGVTTDAKRTNAATMLERIKRL